MGTFEVKVENMSFSTEEHQIRKIDPCHAQDIVSKMKIAYQNGEYPHLPEAIGIVTENATAEEVGNNKINVEIIDGNHTLQALKELHEEYPDAECFAKRYKYL